MAAWLSFKHVGLWFSAHSRDTFCKHWDSLSCLCISLGLVVFHALRAAGFAIVCIADHGTVRDMTVMACCPVVMLYVRVNILSTVVSVTLSPVGSKIFDDSFLRGRILLGLFFSLLLSQLSIVQP